MVTTPFEIIKKINSGDKTVTDQEISEGYIPFIINKSFSFTPDTILYANEINSMGHLPKEIQADYYFSSISPKKRFAKWLKKDEDNETLKIVAAHYNVGLKEARELLSTVDFEKLKNIGGPVTL